MILFRVLSFIKNVYALAFTLVFWQPIVWDLIKPSDGVIDNKSKFIHRHAVKQLNICRGRKDGWALVSILKFKLRDPHAHIQNKYYRWSKSHLFVIER